MSADFRYEGTELDMFGQARHWKAYWASVIAPFMGTRVLDIGAGLGATAAAFAGRHFERWTAVEPDPKLADRLAASVRSGTLPPYVEARCGTLEDVPEDEKYDTVLYVDVLEHIEDDRAELVRAARVLADDGRVIVLAPAHNWLFTPFDRAIGHYRRYNRPMLNAIKPPGLSVDALRYLDSAGLLASLANRLVLRTANPTPAQIAFWDRCLVPVSRVLDPMFAGSVGKSVVAVFAAPSALRPEPVMPVRKGEPAAFGEVTQLGESKPQDSPPFHGP